MHLIKKTWSACTSSLQDDTGDVPGWVLITVMTAGLVMVIWAVASPMLTTLFKTALSSVVGP